MEKITPVAVITGASRGIGKKTAELFLEKGYLVTACYNNNESGAKELENRYHETCIIVKTDVRSTESVKQMLEKTKRTFGRIDVLVNNAGTALIKPLTDISEEEMREIISVDLEGCIRCSKEVIPYFLEEHKGSIVNVSSVWGISGASCETVYSAAKAGVIGFTKALSKELGISGIRVNCVAPGVIDTDMNASLSEDVISELEDETPLGRIGKPEEVAELIYFLASEKASFITGQTVGCDGGFGL